MKNIIAKAMARCKTNAFSRPAYTVDIPMDDVVGYFLRFLNRDLYRSIGSEQPPAKYVEGVFERTPPFQRNNDKWTPEMQSAFIRNALLGMKPHQFCFIRLMAPTAIAGYWMDFNALQLLLGSLLIPIWSLSSVKV